jgi:rhamnosyl/mannosyltransferase
MPTIPARLLIGGSGPEQTRLLSQAAMLGVADRVHFLGDIPDEALPALYQAADIFVMPAHLRAEALGLAQIEALASGIPSVSTELGTGTSFANRNGETGLVVPPGDSVALSRAINTLLAEPDLRRRMGDAGRQRVAELFSRKQMVAGNEAVYRAAVLARPQRS